MENANLDLCIPLKQLKDEHVTLRKDMNLFYEIVEDIQYDEGPDVIKRFIELCQLIVTFTSKLKAHSKREEYGLFPMISRHLGEDDRTIEEMENEHQKAEQHLQDFMTETNRLKDTIDENDAQWITVYAQQAHAILIQHFAKEEKVLFPLAERLLTIDEKADLKQRLRIQ